MPDVPDVPAGVTGAWARFCPVPWPHGPAQQHAAGRHAAAAALHAAGAGPGAHHVPRGPGGRPLFPPGYPGSISHTDRLAVAVVVPGARAVGTDLENAAIAPRVAGFVLAGPERHRLLEPAGPYTPRELFAAKEAAFKAMHTTGAPEGLLFWQIRLARHAGTLTASHHGRRVPVWVRSTADLSFAVAVRR
ncbi:hypothetical protein J5Y04_37390 [Kitasatospora sp. RG8]|uniref:hypothetical protein n=1 Tax=Kitasatospora sp. RG8 TaxID=2820815 RepID=UPI001ADF5213|nr:hypothetical protein [Kitasatospora sp. RG8]MBP0455149.1 hypothetical protein [Kitasatospora sp. RG8]